MDILLPPGPLWPARSLLGLDLQALIPATVVARTRKSLSPVTPTRFSEHRLWIPSDEQREPSDDYPAPLGCTQHLQIVGDGEVVREHNELGSSVIHLRVVADIELRATEVDV